MRMRFHVCTLSMVLLAACGGGGGGGEVSTAGPETKLDCSALQFESTSAPPLAPVRLVGAGALGIDPTWHARVQTSAGDSTLTGLAADGSGGLNLIAPIHPGLDMAGGKVALTLTDGSRACEPIAFEVATLAPAADPTYTQALAARMRELLAVVASSAASGHSTAELSSLPLDQLPVHLLPMALAATLADSSAEVGPTLAILSEAERTYLNALLERLDLLAEADRLIASFGTAPAMTGAAAAPVERSATAAGRLPVRPAAAGPVMPPLTAPLAGKGVSEKSLACSSLGAVDASVFAIDSPADLSDYIKTARGLKADLAGPLGARLSGLSAGFGALGLLSPPAGAILGWLVYGYDLIAKMRANLYPNEVTELTYQLPKSRIEEDWSRIVYQDPAITWHTARLYASNSGMSLIRPTIDAMTNATSLPGLGGAVTQQATGVVDFLGKNALGKRLDELQKQEDADSECWSIGATRFGPVIVPDDDYRTWLEARVIGDSVEHDAANRELIALRLGASTLELKTLAEPFPGPIVFSGQQVSVLRKTVRFLPATPLFVAQAGGPVEVRFRVDDSKHAGLADVQVFVDDSLGGVVPITSHTLSAENVHAVTIDTPVERDRYPLKVTAQSGSLTLDPLEPERSGSRQIDTNERLSISPESACLAHGATQRFTASFSGTDPAPVVRWQIVSGGGSLSAATGLEVDYMAPAGDSIVTLRASWDEDPAEVFAEVSFQVGKCVGLSVYYQHHARVAFPGSDPGCLTNDDGEQELLEDTLDQTPAPDEPVPPGDAWFGRASSVRFDPVPGGSAARGFGPPDNCSSESFQGRSTLDSTLQSSADGSRLDVDIAATSRNQCAYIGALGREACSDATAVTGWYARYDIAVAETASYRIQVTLDCARDLPLDPGLLPSNVSVGVIRFQPDGSVVQTNSDLAKAFMPSIENFRCVDAQSAVRFDRTLEFDAPAAPGQADRVVVYVYAAQEAASRSAFSEGTPGLTDTGAMSGFVEVTRSGQ